MHELRANMEKRKMIAEADIEHEQIIKENKEAWFEMHLEKLCICNKKTSTDLDRVRWLHFEGDRLAGEGLDENLHGWEVFK